MIRRTVMLAVIAAACGWALLRFAYGPIRCNVEVSELTAQTDLALATTGDYERLARARRNLQRLRGLKHCRTEVRVPFLTATNEELAGSLKSAVVSYHEALAIEQRPEIYTSLAAVQLRLGEVDAAVESYSRAVQFVPVLWYQIPSEEVRRRVTERTGEPMRPASRQSSRRNRHGVRIYSLAFGSS